MVETVTVSPKFQVVIPKNVREQFGITPGQRLQVVGYDGRIELLPVINPVDLRGFVKGIDTTVEREDDRL